MADIIGAYSKKRSVLRRLQRATVGLSKLGDRSQEEMAEAEAKTDRNLNGVHELTECCFDS